MAVAVPTRFGDFLVDYGTPNSLSWLICSVWYVGSWGDVGVIKAMFAKHLFDEMSGSARQFGVGRSLLNAKSLRTVWSSETCLSRYNLAY